MFNSIRTASAWVSVSSPYLDHFPYGLPRARGDGACEDDGDQEPNRPSYGQNLTSSVEGRGSNDSRDNDKLHRDERNVLEAVLNRERS